MPSVSGVGAACIDTTSDVGQQRFERVVGGVVGCTGRRRSPACRALRAATWWPGRPRRGRRGRRCGRRSARPGSAGRGSCRRGRPRPCAHVAVGREHVAGDGEQQRDGDLGHAVGVAAGRVQHRECPRSVAAATSTLVGSPRVEPMTRSGRSSTSPCTKSASHTSTVAPELVDPLGQLRAVPDPQRRLVEPRVEHDVAHLAGAGRGPGPRKLAVTRATGRSGDASPEPDIGVRVTAVESSCPAVRRRGEQA